MSRKERVLKFIRSKEYVPLKFAELSGVLGVPHKDKGKLERILSELEKEGLIYKTKKKRYLPKQQKSKTITGIFSFTGNAFAGYVSQDNPTAERIFVYEEDIGGAFDGDTVSVETFKRKRKHNNILCGKIIKVVRRANSDFTGVINEKKRGFYTFVCDNKKIPAQFRIAPDDLAGAKTGDRVIISSLKYNGPYIFGAVSKILGNKDTLSSMIGRIIHDHDIKTDFSAETLSEAENIPEKIDEKILSKRLDLREKTIFTIDGDDARDFDDAVSIEKTDYGYLLGVHIADVSHYVKEGSPLDKEAFRRGTSVYLPDRVIPMLPERLSNGVCSLNPNVDRLTFSVIMKFDKDGNRLDYQIRKSVIRSCERMTYKNAETLLDGTDKVLMKRYKNILPALKLMRRLHLKLEKQRTARGSIDFDIDESNIILNAQGEPVGVEREIRLVSQKIIESFMLAANEAVAEFAVKKELPFIYRIHENPGTDKMTEVKSFLKNIGVRLIWRADGRHPIKPKQIQSVLKRTKGTPLEQTVSMYILRSMMKAKYSPECKGHFGLAAEFYCHFTSPIRRYPDLAIHRILSESIDGGLNEHRIAKLTSFAERASLHSSEKEVDAIYCERDADELFKTAYMRAFIGKQFNAKVSSLTDFGIFAELENGVEGLIRFETMKSDYYNFDRENFIITGKRKGRTYRLGDSIEVLLVRADVSSGQIDFILKEDITPAKIEKAIRRAKGKNKS